MAKKKSTENNLRQYEEATADEKNEPIKPSYVSKDGFETVMIRRGLYEIKCLLMDLEDKNTFICGGYVRYMASPTQSPAPPGDVDIYCYDVEAYEACRIMFKEYDLDIRFENEMAITYKKPEKSDHRYFACPTIQLIKPVVEGSVVGAGDMQTILENFDFTIIRCGLKEEEEMDKIKTLFDKIVSNNPEDEIYERINELKPEYVRDWEDEFEDIHEAYEEQGRGEAESQTLHEIIPDELNHDDTLKLTELLAEHYYLSLN